MLLVSGVAAQVASTDAISVQDVKVVCDGEKVRVEIRLSAALRPTAVTASHPDRLVLEFPNTISDARQRHILVGRNGVREVRFGLNSSAPPVTHLVVDLEQSQPYTVTANGNLVTLSIGPAVTGRNNARQGAPAAGASGGLIGVFRHRKNPSSSGSNSSDQQASGLPAPPPSLPPIQFPEDGNGTVARATTSTNPAPSAAHPNRGSLQEGTVFPSMGAPGTGNVPGGNPTTTALNPSAASAAAAPHPAVTAPAPPPSGVSPEETASVTVPSWSKPGPSLPVKVEPPPATAAATVTAPQAMPPAPPTSAAPALASTPAPTTALNQNQNTPRVATQSQAAVEAETQAQPATAKPTSEPAVTAEAVIANPQPTPEQPEASSPEKAEEEPSPAAATNQATLMVRVDDPSLRTVFKVKYVADGVAYLDGGRSAGLAEGMKLEILDSDLPAEQGKTVDPADPKVVAELEVSALAESSAVTDIRSPKRAVKVGDLAYLSAIDAQTLVQQRALSATRKYPAVISFTEGDPIEEEAHADVPRPPMPSVNRARGRIGFDYLGTVSHGTSSVTSSNVGVVFRGDITRINGTYWNLSGYWRGRLQSTATDQQTLQDLLNRTYHLNLTYDNPNSAWVAGFGRMYLPWATSLDTIDGGYFGRRFDHGVTAGIFLGSTPDPTSWSYAPNREIGGAFVNFEGGSYDDFHYTSTSGAGLNMLSWQVNKPFVFFENSLAYKRYLTIYDALQLDSPSGNNEVASPGTGLGRNFLTIRVQPVPRLELSVSHNYFRDVPTADPTLVGTGLLDQFLFQGVSGGVRVEVIKKVWVYTDIGQSNRSGDTSSALNQAYGITINRLPFALHSDLHYSKFNSSFGSGNYQALSLSRNMSENLNLQMLIGNQHFTSPLTSATNSKFVTGTVETSLGAHYFIQGSFTTNRGEMSYDQWGFTIGYRFDSKANHR